VRELLRRLRHELLWLATRALLGIGGRLPYRLLQAVGGLIGSLALTLAATDRRRATEHFELAFPDLDPQTRRNVLRGTARHLGTTLGEIAWLWHADPREVERRCTISGLEHLRVGTGGAVLITGHCGNWELLNARLGIAGVPMAIAVREVFDPRLDRAAQALRARFGATVIPRGREAGRLLVKALATGRILGLLIDQDIRDIPGCFVPFFGRLAWTPSGAASLALKTGRPIVPAFIHRLPDGSHRAEVLPPLPVPKSGTEEERVHALTAAATAAIERQVRAHPEQWVWMHRRWRSRPENEDSG